MDSEVTSLVEGAVARVSGVLDISASSEENNARIRIEFRPGGGPRPAAADVREAVSRATRQLPDAVEQLAVFKADEDAEEIVRVAIRSDRYDEATLTRIVEKNIIPEFIALDGVADVPSLASASGCFASFSTPCASRLLGLPCPSSSPCSSKCPWTSLREAFAPETKS